MRLNRVINLIGTTVIGLLLAVIWLWIFSGPPRLAQADSLTVCKTGCSYSIIQDAIDAAEDGDVVKVASGIYTDVNDYGGLAQIGYISKTITIQGGYTTSNWTIPDPVTNATILDAGGEGRVLFITGDISSTIDGLHITGGDASVIASWLDGGGVFIENANISFYNNWVYNNNADQGGALYLTNCISTLTDNAIFENNAVSDGGGIYFDTCEVILEDNSILNNGADNGAGFYLVGSNSTIKLNDISNNTASNGGGIFLDACTAHIVENNIISNTSTASGGGIFLDACTAHIVENNIISNTSTASGGGIYLFHSDDSFISGNLIASNIGGYGGGLRVLGGSEVIIMGNTIVSNTAKSGGGLRLNSDIELIKNLISYNTAYQEVVDYAVGGGISINCTFGSPIIRNNVIVKNKAKNNYHHLSLGGGVSLGSLSSPCDNIIAPVFKENEFNHNSSDGSGGGGWFNGPVIIESNSFYSNTTEGAGGGFHFESGNLQGRNSYVLHNSITNNMASSGGGIYISTYSNYGGLTQLSENSIYGNIAESGAGIRINGPGYSLLNNLIVENKIVTQTTPYMNIGSGLLLNNAGQTSLLHNTIARNHGGDGSGIYLSNASATITNTIIVSQTIGVFADDDSTISLNATLWGAGEWANNFDTGGNGTIDTGSINFWGDPDFVDYEAGNYHIGPDSLAIDNGINIGILEDIDDQPRPMQSGFDIGADELPPKADFLSNSPVKLSQTTFFTNTSITEGQTSYLWIFGDGESSSIENPSHFYDLEGIYGVNLTTTCELGSDNISKTVVIDGSPPTGSVTIIGAGQTVSLTLSAEDSLTAVQDMQICNDKSFNDSQWVDFIPNLDWILDDNYTVYVRYRDVVGNISVTYFTEGQRPEGQRPIFLPCLTK